MSVSEFSAEQVELIRDELTGLYDDDLVILEMFDEYLDSEYSSIHVITGVMTASSVFKLCKPLEYQLVFQEWFKEQLDVKFYEIPGGLYPQYYFKDMVDTLLSTDRFDVYDGSGKWLDVFFNLQYAYQFSKNIEGSYIVAYEHGYFCKVAMLRSGLSQEAA